MKSVVRALLLAISSFMASGCALFDFVHKYEAISEPPPKGGLNEQLQPRASTIQPALSLPISELQGAANAAAAKVLPFSDRGRERIGEIRIEDFFGNCIICESLDANWHYTAGFPPGKAIVLSGGQDRLAVTVPAKMDGGVGFGGDLADLFDLEDKSINAEVEATIASGLRADINFCPRFIGPSLNYHWITPAQIEVVGKNCIFGACVGPWRINFASLIDPHIRSAIPRVLAELEKGVPCEPVRGALAQIWRNYSFPIVVPYIERMYLNIEPKSMYFPGLGVTSSDILVAGRLDAIVAVQPTPGPAGPIPLPQNVPAPITPGRFSIAVPISAKYYTFEALAKQELFRNEFQSDSPLGEVQVRPKNVTIYPSQDRIAIGIAFVLDFDFWLFNTSGTVWLAAKPTAIDGGKKIRISDVTVTRKFSSPIWEVASVLLEGRVRDAIANGFELDLTQPIQTAEKQLTDIISQAGQGNGFVLTAEDVRIGIGRIMTNDDLFQLEVVLDAIVRAKLERIP